MFKPLLLAQSVLIVGFSQPNVERFRDIKRDKIELVVVHDEPKEVPINQILKDLGHRFINEPILQLYNSNPKRYGHKRKW